MRWIKRVVKTGRHFSSYFHIKRINLLKGIQYKVKFVSSDYYFTNAYANLDQWDWNKLLGVKKHLFQPKRNSVLLGWRYNTSKNTIQLTPYLHINSSKGIFDDNDFLELPYEPELTIHVSIKKQSYDLLSVIISYEDKILKSWQVLNWEWDKGFETLHYFGGNQKAPKNILIDFKRIK